VTAVTLVLAIIGAVTGVVSLAWNVISFRRQGPVIKVRATCTGRGAAMKVTGTVRNTGRLDATLAAAEFQWSPPLQGASRIGLSWDFGPPIKVAIPQAYVTNLTFDTVLRADSGKEFVITDAGKIDPGLEAALHDHRRVAIVIRTASKVAMAPVKYA
jgi:hypothetical protein